MSEHAHAHSLMIAVVDDDESARSGLRAQLQALGHAAQLFESAEGFLAATEAFDCILLDIWLGSNLTGLDLQHRLLQRGNITPVVLVTAEPDHETAFAAGQLGVKAYLPKPIRLPALLDALRKAMAATPPPGLAAAPGSAEWKALLQAAAPRLNPGLLAALQSLTPAEAEVFQLLAREGSSNKAIARQLDKSVSVIEAHRASVIRKLGTGNLIKLNGLLNALWQAAGS